ncbi:MAG: hypothetical protein ABIP48_09045 [Planctomycetota bacterium]
MSTETEIRRRVEPQYLLMFEAAGMSPDEAKEMFDGLFQQAKEASRQKQLAGMDATRLLNLAQTEPGIQRQLEWKSHEGVREEDFQWWWNMPDLERQLLLQVDENSRMGYWIALRRKAVPKGEALQRVRSTTPTFVEFLGNNENPTDVDCPLPVELKARVVQFIERQAVIDPRLELWRKKVSRAGSCNAAIRKEIRDCSL